MIPLDLGASGGWVFLAEYSSVWVHQSLGLSKTWGLSLILFIELRVFIAMQSSSPVFSFYGLCFRGAIFIKPQVPEIFSSSLFSKGFTVLPNTFRSVIHMELICV